MLRRVGAFGLGLMLAMSAASGVEAAANRSPKPQNEFDLPMRVMVVRDARPGCEPDCAQWISAEGKIERSTAAAFERVFKIIGKRHVPIFISSGGGATDTAMAIARRIRALGLDVAVAKTVLDPCQGSPAQCKSAVPVDGIGATPDQFEAFCNSACTMVLAGGVRRVAPLSASVGVHEMHKYIPPHTQEILHYIIYYRMVDGRKVEVSRKLISVTKQHKDQVEETTSEKDYEPILKFFKEMGQNDNILTLMFSAEYTTIHVMTTAELASTNLVTERRDGAWLLYRPSETSAALPAPRALAPASEIEGAAEIPVPRLPGLTLRLLAHYRQGDTGVRLQLWPLNDGRLAQTSGWNATFQVDGQSRVALVTDITRMIDPLTAYLPLSDFCALAAARGAEVTLSLTSARRQISAGSAKLDLGEQPRLAAFTSTVCAAQNSARQADLPTPQAPVLASVSGAQAGDGTGFQAKLGFLLRSAAMAKPLAINLLLIRPTRAKSLTLEIRPEAGTDTQIFSALKADILLASGSHFAIAPADVQRPEAPLKVDIPLADVCKNQNAASLRFYFDASPPNSKALKFSMAELNLTQRLHPEGITALCSAS